MANFEKFTNGCEVIEIIDGIENTKAVVFKVPGRDMWGVSMWDMDADECLPSSMRFPCVERAKAWARS